jgi:hypothetical protein
MNLAAYLSILFYLEGLLKNLIGGADIFCHIFGALAGGFSIAFPVEQ